MMNFFRWKTNSVSNDNVCCGCLHVRHGTILIGVFHLVCELLTLCSLSVFLMKNESFDKNSPTVASILNNNNQSLFETDDSNINYVYKNKNYIREDNFWGLMIVFFIVCFTLMMIYGTLKKRPGYLIPFFCVQVFQFCLACLIAIGAFTYMPHTKAWLKTRINPHFPYHDDIMKMNSDWLMLLVMVFFVLLLSIKAYFMGIVWSCYKYLHSCCRTRIFDVRDMVNFERSETDTEHMTMPPKYEDAVRMSTEDQDVPPAYVP